jgi:AcrR family transcriptional regulator
LGAALVKRNKRQVQKDATRKKIIETAMRAYSRDGFTAPSNLIAKEAGVSHGTIFVHFPTLNDLLICVMQKFFVKIGGKLHDLSEPGMGLDEFLSAHIEILEEYEDFYRALITERRSLPEEAKRILASIQSETSRHFAVVAEREASAGSIAGIPFHILFNVWLGLVHHYLRDDEYTKEGSALKRHKEELTGCFAKLVRK